MVWDTEPPEYQETVMTVYRGEAGFHNRKNARVKVGSTIMVGNAKADQYAAIVIKDKVVLCHDVCHTTTISDVIANIPISGSQTQQLSNNSAEQHLPLPYKIGPSFTKVVSITIFISWTIAFFQGRPRLYIPVLHKECGWWIIAAFSNALFTAIMMPTTILRKAFEEIKERLNDLTQRIRNQDPETPPHLDPVHPYNTVHRTIVTYSDDDTAKSDNPS